MVVSLRIPLITIYFSILQLGLFAQVYTPVSKNIYCLDIVETNGNPTNFYVYLDQMSEHHLDTASNKKVFRYAGMGGHGIDKGHSLYKLESTETNCKVTIKIVIPPKRKRDKLNQLMVYVWEYEPTVCDAFVKLADSTFLNLKTRLEATGAVHDGSYTFYEYRNMDKYNRVTRNPRSTSGDEVTLERFIKDLIGPMYGDECN